MRLSSSLAAAFAGLALALTLVAVLAIQLLSTQRVRARIGNEVAALAGQVRTLLDTNMSERWSDMQVMAAVAATTEPAADGRRAWLEALRRTYPAYAWLGFADARGSVMASTGRLLEGASVAERPWFREGLAGAHVGDVHEAALLARLLPPLASGEPLRFVDVSAPVRDAAGAVVGVVGGHLSWSWAGEAVESIVAPALARDPRIDVLVVGRDGTVLLGPAGLRGTRLPADLAHTGEGAEEGAAPILDAQVSKAQVSTAQVSKAEILQAQAPETRASGPQVPEPHPPERHALQTWPDGQTYLVGASRATGIGAYPGLGWTILVRQPADAAFAPARRLGLEIAAGGLVFAVAFALIGWAIAGRIAAPVLALARAAGSALGPAGAWDLRLPPPRGCAEVRTLSLALGALSARIAERDGALASANAALEDQVLQRTRELRLARDAAEAAQARAEDASCAKTEFVAMVSHELRTPLNAVMGFTELLAVDGDLGPTQRRYAEAATASGATLRAIVDDVLDLSQVEAGQLTLDPAPFRLEGLVGEALDVVMISAERKGLALAREIEEGAAGWWRGDAKRLRQILVNLLGNAVKFTESGRVAVAVRREALREGGARLRFAVTDTGIGIAEDRLERVFGAYAQADGSISRRFGGTGLGLAIVKSLVERMGGAVGVHSQLGEGSTLWFTLDLDAAEAPAPDPAVAAPAVMGAGELGKRGLGARVSGEGARGARLLLVDDLPLNREIAGAVLARAGYAVETAASGEEAVAAVAAGDYDLVLMDVQMGGLDGLGATRAIRALPSGASRVPIVAMSANVMPEQVRLCRAAGMDGHIGKPFAWDELYAVVEAHRRGGAPRRAEATADAIPAEPLRRAS